MSQTPRRRLLASGAALLALTLASPSPPGAQESGPAFGETLDVQLVVVDVFVSDRQGEPVADLSRGDFELREDGEPVPIGQFSAFASGTGPSGTAGAEPPPGRLVIFLDELHLGIAGRGKVIDQLQKVLRRDLRPGDEVMVARFNGSPEVVLPWTSDRGAIKRALDGARQTRAMSLLADLGEDRALQLIERRHAETTSGPARDACVDLGYIARTHAEQVHQRVLASISGLEAFVTSLAGFPGRKALLHVSDGIPLVPGNEVYRFAAELCDGSGMIKGIPNAVDTKLFGSGRYTRWDPTTVASDLQSFNTADQWSDLAALANSYQVAIYPVQSLGAAATAGTSIDRARTSFDVATEGARNHQDSLFLMADETGGRAILDTNDFTPELERMIGDQRAGYQLAYTPPTPRDGKQHRIQVAVDRPGVTVRHRRSYRSRSLHEEIADRVRSSLFHGHEVNPLGVRLEVAGRQPVSRNRQSVTLQVRVPTAQLVGLPGSDAERRLFSVFLAARDDRGNMTPVGQKTIPLRSDPAAQAAEEYVYEIAVELRDGRNELGVAVRDEIGGETSVVRKQVRVDAG